MHGFGGSDSRPSIREVFLMPKNNKLTKMVMLRVLIHPFSQGYLKRACDDWNKRIVKQQGSILLPGGTEARPGATYEVPVCPEITGMIADGVLLAGSKVI